jgi:lipid-binding SYLF domain-containing protein
MKKLIVSGTLVALVAASSAALSAGWDPEKDSKEMAAATETVKAFKADHPNMQIYFDKAYGYAVFSTIGSAAFVFGGSHGKGKVFEQGKLIGDASLSKASIGLQAGGETYSMLIFFQDKATLEKFKTNKVSLAAGASVTAMDKGKSATMAWSDGIAVFTRNKGGLMAAAAVGGQQFEFTPTGSAKK